MSTKLQQQGFVLVSVLLITSISTFLALSAISESRLQERIAGIQVKEVNARAKAEKGLFDIVQDIIAKDADGDSSAEIITALNGSEVAGEYSLTIESGGTENILKLTSTGFYNDAIAYLNAEVYFQSSNLITGGAIIACDSITLSGSGTIDSYDSTQGTYNPNSANSNAGIVTINGGVDGDVIGDVNITGGATIKGNLTANGAITQTGSATFGGNVAAEGSISLAQANVAGNISSNLNISLSNGTVGDANVEDSGNVSAIGTLKLDNGSEKTINAFGEGKGIVLANQGLHADSADSSGFSDTAISAGASEVAMTDDKCNQLDIANAMPTVGQQDIHPNLNSNMNSSNSTTALTFTESTAQVFNDPNDNNDGAGLFTNISPISLASSLWNNDLKSVYVFDELDLSNTMITIDGDITIMVTGDLITSGGGSGFQLGDSGGSLTILVEGQTHIGSSSTVFANATIDGDNPKVPLTIYSSYASTGDENAVYLNGATNMYAKVYAPLGNIEYAASGSMMGSLEGKNVSVSGAGSVHYDEALALFIPPPSDAGIAKFTSLYYYYPNN